MKIKTEAFSAAMELAKRAAANATPLDILRFARFVAKDGAFTLACNNLSLYAEARGECGPGEMEFCVRADRLGSALTTAGDSIDLALKESMLTWKSGGARYQMGSLPVRDFPEPKRDKKPLIALDFPDLADSLQRVAFGCATRDFRVWAHGVLIECVKDKNVVLVATDGAKMASFATEVVATGDAETILHRDAINALADGVERVRIFRESIEFDYPNGLIISRTIEGKFPDWRRASTPSPKGTRIKVGRLALAKAVKAALPFDQAGAIRLHLADNSMRVEAAEKSGDSAELQVDVDGRGEADIWLCSNVITPTLQAARGDDVVINFDPGSSGSVFCEDGALRCVCAPMRR